MPHIFPIRAAIDCPHCGLWGTWDTDSSRLQAADGQQLLLLDCARCGNPFHLDLVTHRTATVPALPPGAEPPPRPMSAPVTAYPLMDDWTHGGVSAGAPAKANDAAFAPLVAAKPAPAPVAVAVPVPAAKPPAPGFRPLNGRPSAAPPAAKPPKFVPLPPPPPAVKRPAPTPPKPIPIPEDDESMSTTPNEPKKSLSEKFNGLPAWKQWGIILLAIVVVGVVIALSPIPTGR